MKPEPLKGKKKQTPNSYKNVRGTCDTVYLEKDIKSAVEWYIKFRDNPTDLMRYHFVLWKEFKEYSKAHGWKLIAELHLRTFNNWLLNKAFEDVK